MARRIFQKILLFIDSSDASMAAAAQAVQIAKKEKASLVGLSVVDTDTLNMLLKTNIFLDNERDEYEQELENNAAKYQAYVEKLAKVEGVKIEFQMEKGVAHRVLADAARDLGTDLIVLGAAKESIGRRCLLSRERQLILAEVDCAVLLVPAGQ